MIRSAVPLTALWVLVSATAWAYLPVVDAGPHARTSASAVHGPPWIPERAVDGDPATFWRPPRDAFPAWWQAEFPSPQRLFGVILTWTVPARSLSLLIEADGQWATVREIPRHDGDRTEIYLERPHRTRRLRVLIDSAGQDPYVGLAEVECLVEAETWYRSSRDWPVPELALPRTDDPPRIDGRLEDACWVHAATAAAFAALDTGEPARDPTTVFVAADAGHLYFAFDCTAATPAFAAAAARRDQDADDEAVGVLLDTNLDGVSYLELAVNEKGVACDARGTDRAWDAEWFAATACTPYGWSCEIAVPYESLRLGAGTTDDWGVNFWRRRRGAAPAVREDTSWVPATGTLRRADRLGRLLGVNVPVSLRRGLDDLRVLAAGEHVVVVWGDALVRPPRFLSLEEAARLVPNTDAVRLSLAEGETEPIRLLVAARSPSATGIVRLSERPIERIEPRLAVPGGEEVTAFDVECFGIEFVNGRVADALVPAHRELLYPGQTANWWYRSTAGPYGGHTFHGTLEVEFISPHAEERLQIPIVRTVWPIALPERPGFATAGFSFSLPPEHIGTDVDSEAYARACERVRESYREHRISLEGGAIGPAPELAACPDLETYETAYARLAAPWVEAGYRINTPPLPPLPWAPSQNREAALRFWDRFAAARNWTDMLHVPYLVEIPPSRYDAVIREASDRALVAPRLRRLLCQPYYSSEMRFVREFVDDWAFRAPGSTSDAADALAFCTERRAAGDHVWWYVRDVLPLDTPLMSVRAFFWTCFRYGIAGCYHGRAPDWSEAGAEADAAAGRFGIRDTGPASAGVLWWPDRNAHTVYESLRWELLRDGIEDWELLELLRREADKEPGWTAPRLDSLLALVVQGPGRYTLDPETLRATREAVAEAILILRSRDEGDQPVSRPTEAAAGW